MVVNLSIGHDDTTVKNPAYMYNNVSMSIAISGCLIIQYCTCDVNKMNIFIIYAPILILIINIIW